MAAFDTESAVEGAATGNTVYPGWGALAGFVIGGFVGGSRKKRAKKAAQNQRKKLHYLASPAYLAKTTKELTPRFRELAASGFGAQMQSQIATSLARGGYSGTGIGEIGRAVSVGLPEIEAFRQAQDAARGIQANQINIQAGVPLVNAQYGSPPPYQQGTFLGGGSPMGADAYGLRGLGQTLFPNAYGKRREPISGSPGTVDYLGHTYMDYTGKP